MSFYHRKLHHISNRLRSIADSVDQTTKVLTILDRVVELEQRANELKSLALSAMMAAAKQNNVELELQRALNILLDILKTKRDEAYERQIKKGDLQ